MIYKFFIMNCMKLKINIIKYTPYKINNIIKYTFLKINYNKYIHNKKIIIKINYKIYKNININKNTHIF